MADHHVYDALSTPDYRATITGGALTLHAWQPWLARNGPMGALLRARSGDGVTLADLTIVRDEEGAARELVVEFVGEDAPPGAAERAVVRWAGCVGYRRVWLPDRIVEPPSERVGLRASTTCSACGAHWRDGTPEFWLHTRDAGLFPGSCPLCGGTMPQWHVTTPGRRAVRRGAPPGATTPRRASDS